MLTNAAQSRRRSFAIHAGVLLVVGGALSGGVIPAFAQGAPPTPGVSAPPTTPGAVDSIRALYRIVLPDGYEDRSAFVRSLPATNASTPSGFGPQWGDYFVGAGYQRNTRSARPGGPLGADDGSVVAGLGFWSARKIGVEVALTSFSTFRSGFFTRTALSFKAHHLFENGWSVAAGSETAIVLGQAGDGGRANYVTASRVFTRDPDPTKPFSAFGVTIGAGDGRFRSLADVRANRRSVGVFSAVSTRLSDAVGAIADWNGQDLTLSLSLVPFQCLPLIITPSLTDVTRNGGNRPRAILGAGIGMRREQVVPRIRDCFR